ncbi:MAG: hypothetical protein QW232_09350 [Saccharolobus sp.]
MNKSNLIIFSIILSTLAPGILATLHLSFFITLPSILLGGIIAYLTYLLVNVKWDYQGLYAYARDFHPLFSYIFLISWIISYYLYVIYTIIYIPYYVLNLDGFSAFLVSFAISIITTGLILTDPYYAFPVIAFSQIALVIPIGWERSIGALQPIPYLFTNILSSSLLIVCITLSTFIKAEKRISWYILFSFLISSIVLLYGSFLKPSEISIYGSAMGNFGLILAEFTMIRNLFKGLNVNGNVTKILAIFSIPLSMIGNINYSTFYTTLIVPSITLLYISLFSSFISVFKYFKSFTIRIAGVIALALFLYGDYNVITTSKGYLFLESILAIVLTLIISIILYFRKKI